MRIFRYEPTELKINQTILVGQILSIMKLTAAGILVYLMSFIFPNFFVYPYFKWGGLVSLIKFWPFFLYPCVIFILSFFFDKDKKTMTEEENHKTFIFGLITSVLVGVWEEIGYRYVFIFFAMVNLAITNFVLGPAIGTIIAIGAILCILAALKESELIGASIAAMVAIVAILFATYTDPLYWIYGNIFIPVVSFMTFGLMNPILYGPTGKMFLFGALLANAWFRDGRKYQGLFGIISAWYAGLVLLYATITYGLITAIVIHALYDIEIDAFRFITRKTR